LPEQRQIASILTAIDDQIDTYKSKLSALTRLTSGLMQQLLTGKIRVKV
jgi:type I restriction enzyme S subunit